jgi:hypothetical protein
VPSSSLPSHLQHRRRPKPPKADMQVVRFVTANITSWTSGALLLEEDLGDIFFMQELGRVSTQMPDLAVQSNRAGFHVLAEPSEKRQHNSTSAGVGIWARFALWIEPVAWPCPPDSMFASRLAFARLRLAPSRVVLLVSLYAFTGDLRSHNAPLFRHLACFLRAAGLPFLIGGDWQMGPRMVEHLVLPWLPSRPMVLASTQPSFISGEARTNIDFFVASGGFALQLANPQTHHTPTIAKHSPVSLDWSFKVPEAWVWQQALPKPFPHHPMVGCGARPPEAKQWDDIPGEPDSIDSDFEQWAKLAEHSLASHFHVTAEEHRGRGLPCKFRRVSAYLVDCCSNRSAHALSLWRRLHWLVLQVLLEIVTSVFKATATIQYLKSFAPCRGKPEYWPWWRKQIRQQSILQPGALSILATQLQLHIESLQQDLLTTRSIKARRWEQWATAAVKLQGGSAAHKWTRPPDIWTTQDSDEAAAHARHTDVFSQQHATQLRADPWAKLWQSTRGGDMPDLPAPADIDIDMLALPSADDIRRACAAYSPKKAVGPDGFHPRWLAFLPSSGIEVLRRMWKSWLRRGALPKQMSFVMVALTPKVQNRLQLRPVGVLSGVWRACSRLARLAYGRQWAQQHHRHYIFGAGGRAQSALGCAWQLASIAEQATQKNLTSVAFQIDLVKAFDHVSWQALAIRARRSNFNVALLRLLLFLCRMPRYIKHHRVVSNIINPRRSIIPGDSFADLCLRILLVPLLDDITNRFSGARLALLADDIQGITIAPSVASACFAAKAIVKQLTNSIERDLSMKVSQPKLVALTSARGSAFRFVRKCLGRLGHRLQHEARNLGCDFACGAPVVKALIQKGRIRSNWIRGARLARLRRARADVRRIAKTGLLPAIAYQLPVNGASDSTIRWARKLYHRALVPGCSGRSSTMGLALAGPGHDFAVEANTQPVLWWLAALVEAWLPQQEMLTSLARAAFDPKLRSPRPWQQVLGPSSVVVLSLRRAGWQIRTPTQWTTRLGDDIEIFQHSPDSIVKRLRQDSIMQLWEKAARGHQHLEHLSKPPWLQPALQLQVTKSTSTWTARHKAIVRALLEGAFRGKATCSCEGAPHDLEHILWHCPCTAEVRQSFQWTANHHPPRTSMPCPGWWSLGLFDNPLLAMSWEPRVLLPIWAGRLYSGASFPPVAAGGARLHRHGVQSSWALASVVDRGTRQVMLAGAAAATHDIDDEITLLMYALLFFLRHVEPAPVVVYIAASRPFRQVWTQGKATGFDPWIHIKRSIDTKLLDIGSSLVVLPPTSAFIWPDIDMPFGGTVDPTRSVAWARALATQALEEAPTAVQQMALDRAARLTKVSKQVLVHSAVVLLSAIEHDCYPRAEDPSHRADLRVRLPSAAHQHQLLPRGASWGCSRCGLCRQHKAMFAHAPCAVVPLGHAILRVGLYRFCSKCGCRGSVLSRGLLAVCRGAPITSTAKTHRKRLLEGRDPLSNVFIELPASE